MSGLYKQVIDSLAIHYGLVAWSWKAGGWIISKLGYGPEYEVSLMCPNLLLVSTPVIHRGVGVVRPSEAAFVQESVPRTGYVAQP